MDPVLSSLFPVHQIGSDGFNWWIGQVESNKGDDPKKSGRYRVRIVGQHLKDCDATKTEDLPWANVMLPVTTPFSDGGVTGATVDLRQGNWVVGFYVDNDRQKPIIMGSIGHTAGATKKENVEKDPSPGKTCKSFTTFLSPEVNPYLHSPLPEGEKRDGNPSAESGDKTEVGQAGQIASAVPGKAPASFYALFAEATSTNPTGGKVCVEIANPNCGSESDLKGGLTNILSEMFAAVQQSNGQIGTYYVSKVNGELTGYVDHGMKYVNKSVRLVKSFTARVKGEIVKSIKTGVDELVQVTLYQPSADSGAGFSKTDQAAGSTAPTLPTSSGGSSSSSTTTTTNYGTFENADGTVTDLNDPAFADTEAMLAQEDAAVDQALANEQATDAAATDSGTTSSTSSATTDGPVDKENNVTEFPEAKKPESRLKPVFDYINTVLDDIGCSMEDITDQLAQWLTDLLLGFLMDAYSAAACLVDTLVDGIINELLAAIEALIDSLLGPLQELLSAIAAPIDFIGGAIAQVMNLLGISCDGPNAQCEKVTKECTDCGLGETEDWLDKLIESLEDGPLDSSSYVCDEAKQPPPVTPTGITFIGGTFTPVTPNPTTPITLPSGLTTVVPTSLNTISYSSKDITVKEGQIATFTITRSGNTTKSSSITVGVISGSAIENTDFIKAYSGSSIGFAPGEKTKTISFTTLIDSPGESIEEFYIQIGANVTPVDCVPKFPDGKIFKCEISADTINNISPAPGSSGPSIPTQNTLVGSVSPKPLSALAVPITPTFKVTTAKKTYSEGETISFEVTTKYYSNAVKYNYTIVGIEASDIVGGQLTGEFELDSVGAATIDITLATNDDDPSVPDASELMIFSVNNTNAFTSVVIAADPPGPAPAEYLVTADRQVVSEGQTVNFTIDTVNVANGTVLQYKLYGNVTREDVNNYTLEGSFTIQNNQAVVPITILADGVIENSKLMIFGVVGTSATASVIISADIPSQIVTIDTSPSFNVTSDKLEYAEGETVIYTVSTTNVPDGTVLQYTLFGENINKTDIISNSLFGNFTVLNNSAKIAVGIADDLSIENNETVTFTINGTPASTDVIVLGEQVDPEEEEVIISKPCISPPKAGNVITDASGSILSIPIIDRGCPYQRPPKVIITGAGYGASGIALLDNEGYVSEIRITRTGRGYKKNTSDDANLTCVIDSYTLLNPGRGYTSEPDVYIDGEVGLARARINEDGFVYSVEVTDRTRTFKELPSITIIGGGGAGARALPSISCLDIVELESKGYAKIGTGKYIDCP